MAIAFVQNVASGGTSVSATTLVITVGVTTTVGNHLCLSHVQSADPQRSISSLTDSKGNTWQIDHAPVTVAGLSATGFIASCKITTALVSGNTITVVLSGNTSQAMSCQEYSGLAAASWFDKKAEANDGVGSTASDSGLTATTAQADELLYTNLAHVSTVGSFAWEVLSPIWNSRTVAASTGTVRTVRPADRIVAATGTYSAKATWTTTRDWDGIIATYKGAAAVVTAIPWALRSGIMIPEKVVWSGMTL